MTEWKPTWYLYQFDIVDHSMRVICSFTTQAKTTTEAMLSYLGNPLIQDLSHAEVARIVISHKKLKAFDPSRYLEPQIIMHIPRTEWKQEES